jgi:hypothetical protein
MTTRFSPHVDAQRFALVANVLRPALSELLKTSDVTTPDKDPFIQAATVVEWLIGRAEYASIVFDDLDERVAAQILEQPIPDRPEVRQAEREARDFPRPPMPVGFTQTHDLPATYAALEQAEQILRWSHNTALIAAADRISELRACLP